MRIAIAHASAASARALTLVLTRNQEHQVTWSVDNGREAKAKLEQDKPDLLLLDVCIEGPDSVTLTRHIMKHKPCSILLVADQPQARMALIYEAMGLGALDVVTCPSLIGKNEVSGDASLLSKVQTVIRILGFAPNLSPDRPKLRRTKRPKLIAIGASTGGPQAVQQLLAGLPRDLDASILIVQHVDSEFSSGLADWLQQSTQLRVALATEGSVPTVGTAWLAGSNDHMVVTRDRVLGYTPEPREVPYRPSVDALFHSLAEHWIEPGIAVLLTGMGRDGARGLRRLRDAGWHTIAQNEATCVVFGMPKAAIEIGAAERVVALPNMSAAILDACK